MQKGEEFQRLLEVDFTAERIPLPGETYEIIDEHGSEILIKVIAMRNMRWMIQNGSVSGVQVEVKGEVLEIDRPSSKGKLRLIKGE